MNLKAKFGIGYNFVAVFEVLYRVTINYIYALGNVTYTRDEVDGNKLYLTASLKPNAQFLGWYNNSLKISDSLSLTYTLTEDTILEARFESIYTVEVNCVNGAIQYTRGTDPNDISVSVIPIANYHFARYEIVGLSANEAELIDQSTDFIVTQSDDNITILVPTTQTRYSTPLDIHINANVIITGICEEDEKIHITASTNIPHGSVYVSNNDQYTSYTSTLWARPFPDYQFVRWEDGSTENPRTITVTQNVTMVAIYQRLTDTNGIYQYRCFVKDQLYMTANPKAFMVVNTFDVNVDLMTNATSTIDVLEIASNINEGDVLVLIDPKGQFLYQGVIKSIEERTINCSQMQSFYKGLWIYNVHHSGSLEQEIAWLLTQYAQGKIYRSSYTDPLVAQRLGGITIDYVASTTAQLPTDLDKDGNENLTQKDMEQFIYSLYENYGIVFDFEINFSGANYVHIKVPNYDTVKVGNNMFAIQNMSPITTVEETNRLIIYSKAKTYRTTYVATKNSIVEQPSSTANRFDITNTKVVFSDDAVADLIAANLPQTMYNHRLTFTLIIKNFLYEFGEFNLGGTLDIYFNDDYYNSVLTGYHITKGENMNITDVDFVCGKIRTKLTQMLTLRTIGG